MYYERIKPYEFRLHCGVVFHSHTPSVPAADKKHYFPCRRCKTWHSYTLSELGGRLQQEAASARDMQYVNRLDKALIRDRIVSDLRAVGVGKDYQQIADDNGVSYATVFRVAEELGVSDYAEWRATIHQPKQESPNQ